MSRSDKIMLNKYHLISKAYVFEMSVDVLLDKSSPLLTIRDPS